MLWKEAETEMQGAELSMLGSSTVRTSFGACVGGADRMASDWGTDRQAQIRERYQSLDPYAAALYVV